MRFTTSSYAIAEALEKYLGDPLDPQTPFSYKQSVALDELEEYPESFCRLLAEWNFSDFSVLEQHGGRLKSFEELLAILRVVSRRDLTVGIALGQTFLGAVHVWIAGSAPQVRRVAQLIKQNRQLAFALTEQAHGSDILASDVEAARVAGGFALTGEKWLINNGTRAAALTVFAKTDERRGPRGFSMFLVEKDSLDKTCLRHLLKFRTLGIRGADISGVQFNNCLVPDSALVGPLGHGLEIALKGLMVTRALCAGFSLGAVDTALRTTLRFSLERKLYGASIFEIPQTQAALVDCFVELLACDCLSIAAARGLHVVPEQFSIWSAIVKYYVPTTSARLIDKLGTILGARYYLREEYAAGIFQKMLRDNAVVSLFDGSTAVNLHVLALYLKQLVTVRTEATIPGGDTLPSVELICDLQKPLPAIDLSRLEVFYGRRDDIMRCARSVLKLLKELNADSEIDAVTLDQVTKLTGRLLEQIEAQELAVTDLCRKDSPVQAQSEEIFQFARTRCLLFVSVLCVFMWLFNRKSVGGFFARGDWLAIWLYRALASFGYHEPLAQAYRASAAREMVELYESERLFSIMPFKLAQRSAQTTASL